MPVKPNFLERLVLLRLNKGPAPMLDLLGAASFKAVSLALEMDVFEILAEAKKPLAVTTLADRIDGDPEGIAMLCEFLVTSGYLSAPGEGYALTEMTEQWLLDASTTNMGPWFTFWNDLVFPFWERELETAIKEGEPSQSIYEWFDERAERWEVAQAGFRATASLLLDDVTDSISVPEGSRQLIDIGGGHGLYSMELCRRHSNLGATIFDLPGAVEAVNDEIPSELANRVTTRAGDYRTDDLGDGYDLALLFNVIHAHGPDENIALFERIADSLGPDGRVIVLDQWEDTGRTPVSRALLRFVALTYLTTLGANVYAEEEVTAWLREAGFVDVNRRSVGPLSGLALIEATKE